MSIAINDPAWDLPDLDFLNPSFDWRETPDDVDDPEVCVAVVVARALPSNHRAVVRGEIVASPAYIKANYGRMIDRAALGAVLVEMAGNGHAVTVERREVKCGLGAIIILQDNADGGEDGMT